MGTRLQADIKSGARQQRRVLHRTDGIHFGVSLPATHVVTLADDFAVTHDDRPTIGLGAALHNPLRANCKQRRIYFSSSITFSFDAQK